MFPVFIRFQHINPILWEVHICLRLSPLTLNSFETAITAIPTMTTGKKSLFYEFQLWKFRSMSEPLQHPCNFQIPILTTRAIAVQDNFLCIFRNVVFDVAHKTRDNFLRSFRGDGLIPNVHIVFVVRFIYNAEIEHPHGSFGIWKIRRAYRRKLQRPLKTEGENNLGTVWFTRAFDDPEKLRLNCSHFRCVFVLLQGVAAFSSQHHPFTVFFEYVTHHTLTYATFTEL